MVGEQGVPIEQRVSELETKYSNQEARLQLVENAQNDLNRKLDRIDDKITNNQTQLMGFLSQVLGFKQTSVTVEGDVAKTRWTTIGTVGTVGLGAGGGFTVLILKIFEVI